MEDPKPQKTTSDVPERVGWANPIEFLLSCLSYAVGLGNVWRFPYLCYRNGGGAFLVPYAIMLFTMGLPLFFLELAVGQYSGLGPNTAFYHMAPIFQGLGYCTLTVIFFITIYYHVITAWTLFYIFASFTSELGWSSCDYDFNSDFCYSEAANQRCIDSNQSGAMTYKNHSCVTVKSICKENNLTVGDENDAYNCWNDTANQAVQLRTLVKRVMASEEYYNDFAMGIKGATWEDWGIIRWEMVLCLLLAWIIAYLCLVKGVQTMGKVVYFTALFPYVVLTALLVRGATLDGALDGVNFYITPRWELLQNAEVWGDAASQTFYALGIGCGSLVTLASYNQFGNNCHRDAIFVSIANALTAVFAGFAIFSILGFMAHELGVSVDEVVTSGPGLAFIAYPEAVLRMPLPQLWSVLFFFMLFILGLGSQFAGVEAISTAIIDVWPWLRAYKYAVTGGVCFTCFILALPMCCSGGVFLFSLVDWNTAYWAIFIIGLAEIALCAWVYGCNRFLDNINDMGMKMNKFTRGYWWVTWVILAPVSLVAVLIFTLYNVLPAYYANYDFPDWVDALGWLIGVATVTPLPVFAVYRFIVDKGVLLKPHKLWGPAGSSSSSATDSTPLDHVYTNEAFQTDGQSTDNSNGKARTSSQDKDQKKY